MLVNCIIIQNNKGLALYKYLILLFFISGSSFAFDYGKVRINLADETERNSLTFGALQEQSNDLIDSFGLELRYLKSINPTLRLGITYQDYTSEQSSNGKRTEKQLLSNGIIQDLELKKRSLYTQANYRLAHGVMKFVGKYQSEIFMDLGLGLGVSQYESTESGDENSKNGIMYSLELGSNITKEFIGIIHLTSVQEDLGDEDQINQSYLGLRFGYLW